jgi:hypothetical protein
VRIFFVFLASPRKKNKDMKHIHTQLPSVPQQKCVTLGKKKTRLLLLFFSEIREKTHTLMRVLESKRNNINSGNSTLLLLLLPLRS